MNVTKVQAQLQQQPMAELKRKFAELCGYTPNTGNRTFLVKRILWRMQSLKEGTLSERALRRAAELANDADLRMTPPKEKAALADAADTITKPLNGSGGGVAPGTVLTRRYKGKLLQVTVQEDGTLEFEGDSYRSLSAVARHVTGTQWNGHLFFGLRGKP